MSIRQQIETAQAAFNKKYGVEFNFDEYEGSVYAFGQYFAEVSVK